MPFASEFDDVYATIKNAIESSTTIQNGRCFRLDDARPAGRITDRLLSELRAASFCVADLTGSKPNVMWELGFAMALGKPTIVVTQSLLDLPFDIKDMQSIEYQRHHLNNSLRSPLQRMVVDTLACLAANQPEAEERSAGNAEVVGTLLKEIAQLKEIVSEVVHAWNGNKSAAVQSASERQSMCGHWLNTESQSHVYIRIVRDELVAPYCYKGNDTLTGVYFGWRRTGDYWFARYEWLGVPISGFSFLRRDSVDMLNGAWWSAEHETLADDAPPSYAGVPANWVQQKDREIPIWAENFFEEVTREGLASYLAKARSSLGKVVRALKQATLG